ncbi:MAG: hypothetical protein U5K55_16140 [Aliarcobacter sp.]|nr:hypothetical protein [Aliarcobacter sp.]
MLKSKDITPSMENMMKLFKPIIILDEAHKSSTGLSLKVLLYPSFILNLQQHLLLHTFMQYVLYSVNATQLIC